jgi:CTP:molybdopterin cytidylyltransferase MocA
MAGKCQQRKRGGGRCRGQAGASGFCNFHDPAQAGAQARGRKAGARARNRKAAAAVLPADTPDVPLATMREVAEALAATFNHVRKGALDPRAGNCLAVLGGQLLKALERGGLEERLAAVEEALANGRV